MIKGVSIRSLVVLLLVVGSLYLAVVDKRYRNHLSDLAHIGLGGYLGQLVPTRKE